MPLKQVVILDTCAAGGASNDLMKLAERRDISPDQRRAIELLKDATGTFILMGVRPIQQAMRQAAMAKVC